MGERVLGKVFQEFAMKGQGRFMRYWKTMSVEEREKLKREFERIDLAEITKIYLKCRSKSDNSCIDPATLKPLPKSAVAKLYDSEQESIERWRDIGFSAVNEGKMGVVLMAGIVIQLLCVLVISIANIDCLQEAKRHGWVCPFPRASST